MLTDYGTVCDEVSELRQSGAEALCGDFNAHLPFGSDYQGCDGDAIRVCPRLLEGRQLQDQVPANEAGHRLQAVAALNDCVLTTGCGKGDEGEPSYVGYSGGPKESCPDHAFMTLALCEALRRVEVMEQVSVSDHKPLSLCLWCAPTGVDLRTRTEQNSRTGGLRQVLRWREEDRPAYAQTTAQDNRREHVLHAIETGEVNAVGSLLQDIVVGAAASVGMLRQVRVGPDDARSLTRRHKPWL